jgi:hypothetical protein
MRTKIVPLMAFTLAAVLAFAGAAGAQSEDPNPEAPQWLDARYQVSLDDAMQELTLDGEIELHKVEPSNRMLERHCGSTCSADELREAYQRSGDSTKQAIVDGMESTVEDRVAASLAGMAGEGAQPSSQADVDEASLAEPAEGDEYQPAIPINATGSVELGLLDGTSFTTEQVQALFDMGARVDQPIAQEVEAGTNLTLVLSVQPPVAVMNAGDGVTAGDGSQVVWTVNNWDSGQPAQIDDEVRLGNPDVEVPTETDAEVEVTLDISNVNVDYPALLGEGQPADARVGVTVDGEFGAIENPRDLDRVHLDYLSADAIRIALEHDLLDTSQLITLEDRARQQIASTFEGMTNEDVRVSGGFPANDLTAEAVGEPVGTGEPISLRLNASAQVPFPPEQPSGATTQGFTVTTLSMGDLDLPQLDVPYNVDAKITVVLPEGLQLDFQSPDGYTVEEHTRDGRTAYTFASTEDGSSSGDRNVYAVRPSRVISSTV